MNTKQTAEYVAWFTIAAGFKNGNLAAYRALTIKRNAARHYRLMEYACNVSTDEKHDKKVERIRAKIRTDAQSLGMDVEFSGDPRGHTVYLKSRDGEGYNDIGKRGYGIS